MKKHYFIENYNTERGYGIDTEYNGTNKANAISEAKSQHILMSTRDQQTHCYNVLAITDAEYQIYTNDDADADEINEIDWVQVFTTESDNN